MSGDLENPAWIALFEARDWVDRRFGATARLRAGWLNMDTPLACAFESGAMKALGRHEFATVPLFIPPASAVVVSASIGQVTVTKTLAAPSSGWTVSMTGPPVHAMTPGSYSGKTYRQVQISAESLRAWCATCLGNPSELPEPQESQRPRATTLQEHARRVAKTLYGDSLPIATKSQAAIVREVQASLEAEDINASPDIIRWGLGFKK